MKYNLIHSHEIWFNSLTSELSSEESKKVIISRKYFFIALLLCHDKWKHNHIAAFSKKPLKKWNHSDSFWNYFCFISFKINYFK